MTIDANNTSHDSFDRIYDEGSLRLASEGEVWTRYRLPKYFSFLRKRYRDSGPLDVLEIGAGIGEIAKLLVHSELNIRSYVGTEYSLPACKKMFRDGFDLAQMDAEHLAFPDNSFDLVFCYDVMHHVANPRRMAEEIVRVTRKHFLLSEANGISPVRKLGERNAFARALGEKSYFPWTYQSFFPRDEVANIELRPFYILVPPKTPTSLIPNVIKFSEFSEHVEGLRWIGQCLLIAGEKRQR
jgi:SAM-dependent methyltransferase